MNIHNAGQVPKAHFNAPESTAAKSDSNIAKGGAETKLDSAEIKSSLILERLKLSSQSRESLLNEVKANLEAGSFTTRQAAESAADGILES